MKLTPSAIRLRPMIQAACLLGLLAGGASHATGVLPDTSVVIVNEEDGEGAINIKNTDGKPVASNTKVDLPKTYILPGEKLDLMVDSYDAPIAGAPAPAAKAAAVDSIDHASAHASVHAAAYAAYNAANKSHR
ncbi:hypothetical protein [Paraherbaspirillum soli]|uniref:Uncharacterized protein n=1 Tax=Paraherbaspirillum soli TaxID=631222 RepID=A0ABW0MFI0_9BURK